MFANKFFRILGPFLHKIVFIQIRTGRKMQSIRHFGRIIYKSSQLGHTSYLSSFKKKSSIENKSTPEANPSNSMQMISIPERFLDNEHNIQNIKLPRCSVRFTDHNIVDRQNIPEEDENFSKQVRIKWNRKG